MEALYGLYPDPESADAAYAALARSAGLGVREDRIVVISSEPFEERGFAQREARTAMPWLAALGALVFGLVAFLFVSYTQRDYALPTGGMAVVTKWPDAIVTYEFLMFGAIFVTFVTLAITARVPTRAHEVYDPDVSSGMILVGVSGPDPAQAHALAALLRQTGAAEVRQFADGRPAAFEP